MRSIVSIVAMVMLTVIATTVIRTIISNPDPVYIFAGSPITVGSDILPAPGEGSQHDIGKANLRFRNGFFDNVFIKGGVLHPEFQRGTTPNSSVSFPSSFTAIPTVLITPHSNQTIWLTEVTETEFTWKSTAKKNETVNISWIAVP